jgi:hypothetical protein
VYRIEDDGSFVHVSPEEVLPAFRGPEQTEAERIASGEDNFLIFGGTPDPWIFRLNRALIALTIAAFSFLLPYLAIRGRL